MENKYVFNIVGTPIGNLEDISLRAIHALQNADIILCEDIRVSKKMFSLLGLNIKAKLISFHLFNEKNNLEKIIFDIKSGLNLCLISDAGMPLVNDPGFNLIAECKKHKDIFINVISGPCALIHAFIKANQSNVFSFLGFLAPKSSQRQAMLKSLNFGTYIAYLSPHKLIDTINDFNVVHGENVKLYLIKEMTKLHENEFEGSPLEVLNLLKEQSENIKGEFTLVFTIAKEKKHEKINKYKNINNV